MAWEEPKTDWQVADVVSKDDFNRIEGNIQELQDTKETLAGAQAKANTAEANAKAYTNAHEQKAAPHSGHETPAGAQAKAEAAAGAVQAELDAHLSDYTLQIPYAITTGSANNYSVLLSGVTSYYEGMAIAVKINVNNTGASTINVNGLGAKAIKKPNGSDVAAGNLKAGSIYSMRYNGTNFILQGSDAAGNATPGDVLSGKTFSNDEGEQTGSMPNRGAVVITPGTTNQAIAAGYHNGNGYVKGDTNLVAANIRSGKSIFGVAGTLKDISNLTLFANNTLTASASNYLFTYSATDPINYCITLNKVPKLLIILATVIWKQYYNYPAGPIAGILCFPHITSCAGWGGYGTIGEYFGTFTLETREDNRAFGIRITNLGPNGNYGTSPEARGNRIRYYAYE